mmetsp:Transcript_20065/g.50806  ORF Transcript_20065/g.50806 Transcript_20065/m.50806 type:complete len:329 (-) Transcript_20065:1263-2249(-)
MRKPRVVFSDLDGTLVHFERHFRDHGATLTSPADCAPGHAQFEHAEEKRRCVLLPTSTMGPGVMSLRTMDLITELRGAGVLFVYVTGARCSTLMERLPLMAPVDAAFGETGGRYLTNNCSTLDPAWTAAMEVICGPSDSPDPPSERKGALWDWARFLTQRGFAIDARSYFFGFRVDLDKQATPALKDAVAFHSLVKEHLPAELSMASNLGKQDFFPAISGKGNAVRHFLREHGIGREEAIAMFDDENDLPMAEQVGISYVLQSTHEAVNQAVSQHPNWHLATKVGVLAAEEALEDILARVRGEPHSLSAESHMCALSGAVDTEPTASG